MKIAMKGKNAHLSFRLRKTNCYRHIIFLRIHYMFTLKIEFRLQTLAFTKALSLTLFPWCFRSFMGERNVVA